MNGKMSKVQFTSRTLVQNPPTIKKKYTLTNLDFMKISQDIPLQKSPSSISCTVTDTLVANTPS